METFGVNDRMTMYKFYDSDSTGKQEFDIVGLEYQDLLRTCFKYCSSFSVIIRLDNAEAIKTCQTLEPYRIELTPSVQKVYEHYGSVPPKTQSIYINYEIRHYKLLSNSLKILNSIADSVFKWTCAWGYNNPDDLAFFRDDGSVFFSSIIHEGECTLMPRSNEDITTILNNENWKKQ